jgi:putative nucleotidyltransferase with HDIG domain
MSFPRPRRPFLLIGLLFAVSVLSAVALLVPLPTAPNVVPLSEGEPSPQDILAPSDITYESDVLTEQQRELAAESVSPEYAPPDASVARSQVNKLRSALTFISSVRADEFASPEQKTADLAALQSIHLSPESTTQLLSLPDDGWQSVQQESIVVLEQVMRSTIREDRLEDARRSVPALVSLSLPEDQAALVSELVSAFVIPNSLYSETLTEEKRQAARDAVEPYIQSFVVNQVVVPRGHVITDVDLEALLRLGLLQQQTTWQDITSVIALVGVNFAFVALYFAQRPDLREDNRSLLLMSVLFLVFLYGARLVIPNRTVIPYLFPIAGFAMIVTALISSRAAMILTVPLSILAGYGLPNSLELILFYMFCSMFGVLSLRNVQRILTFFWAGIAVMGSGSAVILAFRLIDPTSDAVGIFSLIAATAFHGLAAAALTILLQFILAQTLGLTTTLQLFDISRPGHPLLQFLLRNAPGTYQHSLQIANLAEQAAKQINANTLLTRVGALYHDAGKARHPYYFIENKVPGADNPHEELPPLESSAIIIRHVTDGVALAKKYRMPRHIIDFILEHHGTLTTSYQYHQAVEAAGGDAEKVDMKSYRYPGPRPQSSETALVMLADTAEARTRAERPETRQEIRTIVKEVIDQRLTQGQLDDTSLTLKDLNAIVESFTTTLRGVFHPRLEYPKPDENIPLLEQPAPEIEP